MTCQVCGWLEEREGGGVELASLNSKGGRRELVARGRGSQTSLKIGRELKKNLTRDNTNYATFW